MSNMRAWTLHGLPELVDKLGGDSRSMLQQFHISHRQLYSDDATLPSLTFIKLLEACAEQLNSRDFGLKLGYEIGPESMGPVALIAKHCKDVQEAMQAIVKYMHSFLPSLQFVSQPMNQDAYSLVYELQETQAGAARQLMEWGIGVGVRHLQLLVGSNARPYSIHFSHSPLLPINFYRRFFGCPVYFGQEFTSLNIRINDLNKELTLSDPKTKKILADYIERMTSDIDGNLEAQLRASIRSLLPTGRCKLKVIADKYAVSLRTMQRKLEVENIKFNVLLDEVRRELFLVYIAEKSMPMSRVAAMLGYQEQSSLCHACKRWFGKAPNSMRDQLVQAAS
tara:strand:- start:11153 stop:12163 length:1011 start_codon:yes stop_codon:yes gene_type:complete